MCVKRACKKTGFRERSTTLPSTTDGERYSRRYELSERTGCEQRCTG